LTEEELELAKDTVVSFPRVIRSISEKGVGFAILSFLETNDGSYVKLRGVASTKDECNKLATKILKHCDSKIPLVYVKAGSWVPVTNYPKKIATEMYKLVDGVIVADEKKVDEIDRTEKVLEQYYQNEDAESAREMEKRRTLLSSQTVDEDVNAYVVKKMMLHETRKQIDFISKKLQLMKDREVALIDLMSHDNHENDWYAEYEDKLKKIGQTVTPLNADFELSKPKSSRTECLNSLKIITDNFNNLKF